MTVLMQTVAESEGVKWDPVGDKIKVQLGVENGRPNAQEGTAEPDLRNQTIGTNPRSGKKPIFPVELTIKEVRRPFPVDAQSSKIDKLHTRAYTNRRVWRRCSTNTNYYCKKHVESPVGINKSRENMGHSVAMDYNYFMCPIFFVYRQLANV